MHIKMTMRGPYVTRQWNDFIFPAAGHWTATKRRVGGAESLQCLMKTAVIQWAHCWRVCSQTTDVVAALHVYTHSDTFIMTRDCGSHSPCSSRRLEARQRGGCRLENAKRRHVRKTINYCPKIWNIDPNNYILQRAMRQLKTLFIQWPQAKCSSAFKYQISNSLTSILTQQSLWTGQNNFGIGVGFQVTDPWLGQSIYFESWCSTLRMSDTRGWVLLGTTNFTKNRWVTYISKNSFRCRNREVKFLFLNNHFHIIRDLNININAMLLWFVFDNIRMTSNKINALNFIEDHANTLDSLNSFENVLLVHF